jgi:hypothetical protein
MHSGVSEGCKTQFGRGSVRIGLQLHPAPGPVIFKAQGHCVYQPRGLIVLNPILLRTRVMRVPTRWNRQGPAVHAPPPPPPPSTTTSPGRVYGKARQAPHFLLCLSLAYTHHTYFSRVSTDIRGVRIRIQAFTISSRWLSPSHCRKRLAVLYHCLRQ